MTMQPKQDTNMPERFYIKASISVNALAYLARVLRIKFYNIDYWG
jgi:hypothetical protein